MAIFKSGGLGTGVRPPRRTFTGRQLLLRLGVIFGAGALVVALHFTGVLPRLQNRFFPPPVNWEQDYSVVEHLRGQLVQKGLVHDREDCLVFVINGNDPADAQRMQVWDKHSGGCKGPATGSPALFNLKVDRVHHNVQSDQGSPGQFHALAP